MTSSPGAPRCESEENPTQPERVDGNAVPGRTSEEPSGTLSEAEIEERLLRRLRKRGATSDDPASVARAMLMLDRERKS